MKVPICGTKTICVINRKQTASFSIAGLVLASVPLWLMLATANAPAQAQTTSSPADWTQFLRDNMQRYNPYETVLSVSSVGGLKPKWTFTTIGSSPAVANGVVYIGSHDDNVYALNASTGAKLWSYTTGLFVDASPAVANGVVYIASEDGNM
jgi:outer membrane protein assembly factor BamB